MGAGIVLLASSSAFAASVYNFGPFTATFYNNGETDGSYTGYQNWTSTQISDISASIATWDNGISNTQGRQIQLHLFWHEFDGSTIGSTYNPVYGDGTTSWTYAEHIWRDGSTTAGPWTGFDSVVRFDKSAGSSLGWKFGSGSPWPWQLDFRSVATHEIGHALGFKDGFDPGYNDWGNAWGTETSPSEWAGYTGLTRWDANLLDSAGNRPLSGGAGTPGDFNETDNPVYFTGANAVANYGGNVPVYAPSTYNDGSSLSHLDEDTFPDAVMSPQLGWGKKARTPSALEWAIMQDLGWSTGALAAVPEPGTLVLLCTCLLGSIVWRRR
jgi:hypothetical protein